MSKSYVGRRVDGIAVVTAVADGRETPLDPRLDLRNHSPTGLEWGYAGSGPAQCALAILADHRDDETALKFYQRFKFQVISRLGRDGFELGSGEVDEFLEKHA